MPENAGEDLQFDRAEYADTDSRKLICSQCKTDIIDAYYQRGEGVLCEKCRYSVEEAFNSGSGLGRFLRASFYGSLAAAVGALIYFAVLKLTGYQFGLIAIIVGLLVGWGVKKGCNGRGGWLYQSLAIFLTYSAIVVTYIPLIVEEFAKSESKMVQTAEQKDVSQQPVQKENAKQTAEDMSMDEAAAGLGLALLVLFAVAFVAPFLGGFENIVGLIIIGIGVYEAWKINRRVNLKILGPFQLSQPQPAGTQENGSSGA